MDTALRRLKYAVVALFVAGLAWALVDSTMTSSADRAREKSEQIGR